MVVTLSSIGLPGLNGFVGEYMILLGSFVEGAFSKIYVIFATAGVILAAVYMLWMFQRVMFGTLDKTNEGLPDLNAREIVVMLPLVLFIVWIGVYPKPFLSKMEKSVGIVVTQVRTQSAIGHLEEGVLPDSQLALQETQRAQHEKIEKEALTK